MGILNEDISKYACRDQNNMNKVLSFLKRLDNVPQGVIVVASSFLPIFAIVTMFPAVPYLIDHFESDPNARELVPMLVSAPGLAVALTAAIAGVLVDKYGRVKLLTWATFAYGVLGCLPFFLDDLYLILASRFLLGFSEAIIITAVNTLIGDYWKDEGRRDWLFLQGVAGPFFAAFVIRLAGPATEIQWNGVFLIYAVAFIIFVFMKLYLREPKKVINVQWSSLELAETASVKPKSMAALSFPWGNMALVGCITFIASALYYVFIISGGLAFREVGVNEASRISELSAIPSLFVIVGALIFRLLGKQSNLIQLGSFFFVLGSGLLIIGSASSVPMLVAGLVIQQTGAGMTVPSLIAWAQSKLPFEHRGRGMGIWVTCFFLGQFVSPLLISSLEHVTGSVQTAFSFTGCLGLIMAVLALALSIFKTFSMPSKLSNS